MTTDGDGPAAPAAARKRGGWRRGVPYDPELAVRICERVAAGEVLYTLLREPGMPTPQAVGVWARKHRDFGEALSQARRAGGRAQNGGGVWSYTEDVADEIFERMCEGESLTAIGADPAMPCLSTIFHWRRRLPGFEQRMRQARRIQADRFCDLGWDLAMEATPETAYLTQVRLAQLRWTAGVMAPRTYRPKLMEPAAPQEVRRVMFRHFEVETDPETGKKKVVAYTPDWSRGEVIREDDPPPGWTDPPGLSVPGGVYVPEGDDED